MKLPSQSSILPSFLVASKTLASLSKAVETCGQIQKMGGPIIQWSLTFLVPGTGVVEDNFSMHIISIVHFISIIITSTPSQIIRHQILKVRDPCPRVHSSQLSAHGECNLRHSDRQHAGVLMGTSYNQCHSLIHSFIQPRPLCQGDPYKRQDKILVKSIGLPLKPDFLGSNPWSPRPLTLGKAFGSSMPHFIVSTSLGCCKD